MLLSVHYFVCFYLHVYVAVVNVIEYSDMNNLMNINKDKC